MAQKSLFSIDSILNGQPRLSESSDKKSWLQIGHGCSSGSGIVPSRDSNCPQQEKGLRLDSDECDQSVNHRRLCSAPVINSFTHDHEQSRDEDSVLADNDSGQTRRKINGSIIMNNNNGENNHAKRCGSGLDSVFGYFRPGKFLSKIY